MRAPAVSPIRRQKSLVPIDQSYLASMLLMWLAPFILALILLAIDRPRGFLPADVK